MSTKCLKDLPFISEGCVRAALCLRLKAAIGSRRCEIIPTNQGIFGHTETERLAIPACRVMKHCIPSTVKENERLE